MSPSPEFYATDLLHGGGGLVAEEVDGHVEGEADLGFPLHQLPLGSDGQLVEVSTVGHREVVVVVLGLPRRREDSQHFGCGQLALEVGNPGHQQLTADQLLQVVLGRDEARSLSTRLTSCWTFWRPRVFISSLVNRTSNPIGTPQL